MARPRTTTPVHRPAESGPVMPAEVTFNRPEYGWASGREFHAAKRAWLVEHGVDPADWAALHPILVASKRAHARRVDELDARARIWWHATRGADAPFGPPWPWDDADSRAAR